MKESCGVFGVYAPGATVAQLCFDGLYALQHRGQESAGMAVSDGETILVVKDMGLVTKVFDEPTLASLQGFLAIGHTRYSTTGASTWRNAQPAYRPAGSAGFALGHNGNLVNTAELAEAAGMLPGMVTSDSDVLAELLGKVYRPAPTLADAHGGPAAERGLVQALAHVLPGLRGAFSLVLMDAFHLVGARDPNGLRPLCLGELVEADGRQPGREHVTGWVLASESPALDVIGARFVRELEPGEMVVIDERGPSSMRPFPSERIDPRLCIFEFVYFARPDSILYGTEVHGARRRMGELLAREHPVDADLVMGVPESGVPAAEGYARASGIPYGQGLVKNRYIGRTFIDPTPDARARAVRRKLNPLRENIKGKRLVVVDDSFVRGTTSGALVKMLREAGALEVHMRFSSPPFRWPCYYGIDIPTREELAANHVALEDMAMHLGADSVGFLSLDHLKEAIGVPGAGFCDACLTCDYPVGTGLEAPAGGAVLAGSHAGG